MTNRKIKVQFLKVLLHQSFDVGEMKGSHMRQGKYYELSVDRTQVKEGGEYGG